MTNIHLKELTVTQDKIRNLSQIPEMVNFVHSGGFFNESSLKNYADANDLSPSPLIKISKFEDGRLFLHDGHHRAISVFMGDRDYLREDEFQIRDFLYSEYSEIAFIDDEGYDGRQKGDWMGWVTPFDIIKEMRLPDTKEYRENVKHIYYHQSPQHAIHLIRTCPEYYKKKRTVGSIEELVKLRFHLEGSKYDLANI